MFWWLLLLSKGLMYPQTLQALYFIDTHQLVGLHHFHRLMAKHRHGCQTDLYAPIKRLAMVDNVRRSPAKPLTSFKITDILSDGNGTPVCSTKLNYVNTVSVKDSNDTTVCHGNLPVDAFTQRTDGVRNTYHTIPNRISPAAKSKIIRPWSRSPTLTSPSSDECSEDSFRNSNKHYKLSSQTVFSPEKNHLHYCNDEEFIDVEHCEEDDDDDSESNMHPSDKVVSPLDALMAMSSKTFKGLEDFDKHKNGEQDLGKTNVPKKKRKTRTAFTNQQIYELEKRFILQKYLTPADRDEISAKLGLSCAQVITWFQNRRAKYKRDIEEMKNDVNAVSPRSNDMKDKDAT